MSVEKLPDNGISPVFVTSAHVETDHVNLKDVDMYDLTNDAVVDLSGMNDNPCCLCFWNILAGGEIISASFSTSHLPKPGLFHDPPYHHWYDCFWVSVPVEDDENSVFSPFPWIWKKTMCECSEN